MMIFIKFVIIFTIIAISWASFMEEDLSDELSWQISNSSSPTQNIKRSSTNTSVVCLTKDCCNVARMYAEAMNRHVDPCQNFYEFTCGGWAAENPISKSKLVVTRAENLLKGILERPREVTDSLPIRRARTLYESCVNSNARNKWRFGMLASTLARNGGWPMAMNVEDWKEDVNSWQEIDEKFMHLTSDYTFYDIQPWNLLYEDSEDNRILLGTPKAHSMELADNYEGYRSFLQSSLEPIVRHNKANVSAEQLERDIHDLFIFINKLRKVMKKENYRFMHVMKLGTWILDWDHKSQAKSNPKAAVNWHKIIQRMFDGEGIEIDDHWHVMVTAPYYWSLIEIWNTTSKRTIVNYIHWNFLKKAVKNLSNVSSRRLPRWLKCLREIQTVCVYDHCLMENNYREPTEETAQRILTNVKKEFKYRIDNIKGINNHSKSAKRRKLERMYISVEHSDWYKRGKEIELTFGEDYVANIFRFRRYRKKCLVHFFINGELTAGCAAASMATNTAYTSVLNWDIANDAVYFDTPHLRSKVPEYIKYAIVGIPIGHELGMAIKSDGDQKSLEIPVLYDYFRNAHCIWEESDNYFENEEMDARSWYEDIVGTIGMQTSLEAYQRARRNMKGLNGEEKLPGFEEFSDEQMFFIIFGGGLCEHRAAEFPGYELNKHSTAEFRVNNRVYNTPKFAKAFNCPASSPMNSGDNCSIQTNALLFNTSLFRSYGRKN